MDLNLFTVITITITAITLTSFLGLIIYRHIIIIMEHRRNPLPCINCITYPICRTQHAELGSMSRLIKLSTKCSLLELYIREVQEVESFVDLAKLNTVCKFFDINEVHYTIAQKVNVSQILRR